MKKFKVIATMSVQLETVIKADSEEEAMELANSLSGDDFQEIENSGNWSIYSVTSTEN